MSQLKCGLVGLPNVGKSTLFNILNGKQTADAANFPFCTIEPNTGSVVVKDERLDKLSEINKSERTIPTTLEFVDIAGLIKGSSKGEGLGNKFLSNIRQTDAIIHVVRCFDSDDIIHVHGKIDPKDDTDVIDLELILSDLELVEKMLNTITKKSRGDKSLAKTVDFLKKCSEHLSNEQPIRMMQLDDDEIALLKTIDLITKKPVIYAANLSEDDILSPEESQHFQTLKKIAKTQNATVLPFCAVLESEILQLDVEERLEMFQELGIKESAIDSLIKHAFHTLGLITYITSGEKETRAWTIKDGTKAQEAAGKIHSDIQRGFIRAEVIKYKDFIEHGSRNNVKKAGLISSEGKEYVVKDGDIILFLHNT